jgi:ARG/rhodanese/phosphatase superfamily protein
MLLSRRKFLAATLLTLAAGTLASAQSTDLTFSGPYNHENLTIFLIHGKDTLPGKKFLTLQEALEQKKLVVHETGNVNELSVENVADDVEVFIQAGEIVKGGRQDRVLSYDLIVAAKSGKVPLASFCVESGRWSQRAGEDAAKFSASQTVINGKDLRLAVNGTKQQQEVWNKVKEYQMKLEKNVGQSVSSKSSPTSLQLTLEDKKVQETIASYVKPMTKITDGKADVIGYALAINGKVVGADIYGSSAIFAKLWPKLANSCAVDAVAELQKDKKFDPATADAVKAFLAEAEKGKAAEQDVNKRIQVITRDAAKHLVIEARDKQDQSRVIHRCYLAK